jgi:CBS domain-containing protein
LKIFYNPYFFRLTVSRVVQFFHDNKRILGKRLRKPISLIGSSTSGVSTIKESEHAINAFNMMNNFNITTVAVVNDHGEVSGVISQTDLKVISPDGSLFYKLYQNAKSFVDCINLLKDRKQVITVTKSDTFEKVLDLLHDHKIHQIFVINDSKKPVGLISLKDLVKDVICF